MSKTNRKTRPMIQHMEFDSYAEAQDMVDAAEARSTRILIGLAVAAVSTVLTVLAFLLNSDASSILLGLAFLLAIPAYVIGGGLGKAIRSAWNLAVFGWFILPFPYDLGVGLATFCIALMCFFFAPLVFVLVSYCQNASDLKSAREYMGYCVPVDEEVVA